MLIDTHCHLTDPAFDADRDDAMQRMLAAGVDRAVVIASDLARLDETIAWAGSRSEIALASGCHPHDAGSWSSQLRDRLRAVWALPVVRAAGEMGLDYHYDNAPRDVQRAVFAEQLAVAVAEGLPVIIHAREADDDTVAILREQPGAVVVLHSFSSGAVLRDAGLADGWYFSFSGMVTFKSWQQDDTVRAIADERLLLETDSPYLAPVPHRGTRNEPAHVVAVARKVAETRKVAFDDLAAITTANATRVWWNS